jgi:hypothetical protein
MKKRAAGLTLALAASLAPPSGCASILRGTRQRVVIRSESPSANVNIDGKLVAPGAHRLDRGDDHQIAAIEPGKRPVFAEVRSHLSWGYLIVDTLIAVFTFPFGLVAPILDLSNGATFHLDPDWVYLPAPGAPASPPPG